VAENSPIEWTDDTWNPLRGCTRVSPGCGGPGNQGGCYAEKIAARFSDPGQAYHGLAVRTSKGGRWTGKVALAEHLLTRPLKWRRPRRIFVNSMSDLFHESVPDEWIDRVFAVMALAPQHEFQVLTKRAARMRRYFERYDAAHDDNCADFVANAARKAGATLMMCRDARERVLDDWPLPNVWLGVSVEDQGRADERIPHLLATPAAVRFLSCEPLLGPVDLGQCLPEFERIGWITYLDHLDWVIAGGESGPGARPMHPDWARSLRDQCAAVGVPFFFKQWGEWGPVDKGIVGHKAEPRTVDLPLERWGKKAAGRLLDGVVHDAMPDHPEQPRSGVSKGGVEHSAFPSAPSAPAHPEPRRGARETT